MDRNTFELLLKQIRKAGEYAQEFFDADTDANEIKSDGSVVTEVDLEIERRLVSFIKEHYPDDSIVGEEGAGYSGTSGYVWHIDPIDGTDNFLREIPFTAISVARLGDKTEGSFGIVYNPITKRVFYAFESEMVHENHRTHQVNDAVLGGRAIVSIATGKEGWMKSAKYNLMKEIGLSFGRGTALNCAALELGYVAANRIDGVLILGLKTYDYAAGLYLAKTSGCTIHVWTEGVWQLYGETIKQLCEEHGAMLFVSHQGVASKTIDLVGDPKQWAD